jgi:hypothetical protein
LCAAYSLCKTATAAEEILKKNNRFLFALAAAAALMTLSAAFRF